MGRLITRDESEDRRLARRVSVIAACVIAWVCAFPASARAQGTHACPDGEEWSVAHGPFSRPSGHCCPEGTVWRAMMCPDSGGPSMVCARGPLRCGGGTGPQHTVIGTWQLGASRAAVADSPARTRMQLAVLDPLAGEELDAILGDLVQLVRRPLQTCLEAAGGAQRRRHRVAHYRMAGSTLRLITVRHASVAERACFAAVASAHFVGGGAAGPFALEISIEDTPAPPAEPPH